MMAVNENYIVYTFGRLLLTCFARIVLHGKSIFQEQTLILPACRVISNKIFPYSQLV